MAVRLFVLAAAVIPTAVASSAVDDFLKRVVGDRDADFQVEVLDKPDVIGLGWRNGKVVLKGKTGIDIASALGWYLGDYCNTTMEWSKYELSLPSAFPQPRAETRQRRAAWSYYANVCTYGYSLVWADWAYWQKHIDWLALNGVNLPLAFIGVEQVIINTFARFNISFTDMQDFIAGPAFLPWFRMGNMQKWGGPVPSNWVSGQALLQLQILARMRELGMRPVLSAFSGFIPGAFGKKYPHANTSHAAVWNNFPADYGSILQLEPTDPYYQLVGKAWIEEQTKLYGSDHIYNCDTYNEVNPSSADHAYLASSSQAVASAMRAGDPEGIWLMQGWLFLNDFWKNDRVEAYLSGVPDDQMMILDLAAERIPIWAQTQSFFGKPFVWNTLHGYGGQHGFAADVPQLVDNLAMAMSAGDNTFKGIGITMEGIWQNYMVYDLTLAAAFGRAPANKDQLPAWVHAFGSRRYGVVAGAGDVWEELYRLAYTSPSPAGPRTGAFANRPALPSQSCGSEAAVRRMAATLEKQSNASADDTSRSSAAWNALWGKLLALKPKAAASKVFRLDVVDVGRETLTAVFAERLRELDGAYARRDAVALSEAGGRMVAVLDDLDRLLSTDPSFMLGPWIAAARSWGLTKAECDLYEWNARNQLTLWGPNGEIVDYATKAYGGLTATFFKPRWQLFVTRVRASLDSGEPFNAAKFNAEVMAEVEQPWQHSREAFPIQPEEDALEVAAFLQKKYSSAVAGAFFV